MFNLVEMVNISVVVVVIKFLYSWYWLLFVQLFGDGVVGDLVQLVDEVMFVIGWFEIEDFLFYFFISKYDVWLQGWVWFMFVEQCGLVLFNDLYKGNCVVCYLSWLICDGLLLLFIDVQYEVFGVLCNLVLVVNWDLWFYDMGLCGLFCKDFVKQMQYCGMFFMLILCNVDCCWVFFYNGVYCMFKQVLDFYNLCVVVLQKIYLCGVNGVLVIDNDLFMVYYVNIDIVDVLFDCCVGELLLLSDCDVDDIIVFLYMLDDGYLLRMLFVEV